MLYECDFHYKVNPISKQEACCKREGMDPLYILSFVEKEERMQEKNKVKMAAWHLLSKLMESIKVSRQPSPRY